MRLEKLVRYAIIVVLIVVLIPASLVAADPAEDECLPPLEFEGLAKGTIVTNQLAAWGLTVTTSDPSNHPAMIFDSANPTGGDPDLGTPHQDFGGPGVGAGGQSGAAGENRFALGNVLIISEDKDTLDPDDNAGGGTIYFRFDAPRPIYQVQILDIDEGKAGVVRAYDAENGGNLLASVGMQDLGDNSFQLVTLDVTGVRRLEIEFPGSGAVPAIIFCSPDPTAVELASFDASAQQDAVALSWQTASELDVLGFNVYRADSAEGQRTVVSADLIPAQMPGSALGAAYEFVDANVQPGQAYYYWLEAIDAQGDSTFVGPVQAELAKLFRVLPVRPRLVPRGTILSAR